MLNLEFLSTLADSCPMFDLTDDRTAELASRWMPGLFPEKT